MGRKTWVDSKVTANREVCERFQSSAQVVKISRMTINVGVWMPNTPASYFVRDSQ